MPFGAPREDAIDGVTHRQLGIDRVGIDGEAGRLLRKPPARPGQPEIVAHKIHEIGGVAAVEDREACLQTDAFRVQAQQLGAHRMKRSGPFDGLAWDRPSSVERSRADPLDPPRHFGRHPPRESQQQDAPRVSAVEDEVGDTVRKRLGLARSGSGDDQKRWRRSRRLPFGMPKTTAACCAGLSSSRWSMRRGSCPPAGCVPC